MRLEFYPDSSDSRHIDSLECDCFVKYSKAYFTFRVFWCHSNIKYITLG